MLMAHCVSPAVSVLCRQQKPQQQAQQQAQQQDAIQQQSTAATKQPVRPPFKNSEEVVGESSVLSLGDSCSLACSGLHTQAMHHAP